jgi:cyclic pyranopterin monophosphate synthase
VSDLSHVDESGSVRMVDVGAKPLSRRRAVAHAGVRMSPGTAGRLRDLPKGDALATAQLAGIMAAKRTSDLIPLCHPLALTDLVVAVTPDRVGGVLRVRAEATTTGPTGVEMEALTAASVAALTIYDMVKGVERGVEIRGVRLISKTGGKSGEWHRPADADGGREADQRRPGDRAAGRIGGGNRRGAKG